MKALEKAPVAISLFILILAVLGLLVSRITFSYLGATISDVQQNTGEITADGDTLIINSGSSLDLGVVNTTNFSPADGNISDNTSPTVKLVANASTKKASVTYYVGINITENTFVYSTGDTEKPEIILTIKDNDDNIVTKSIDGLEYKTVTDRNGNSISGFDITNKTGIFNIVGPNTITTTDTVNGTTHTWNATLTFVNLTDDQSENENADLKLNIVLQKDKLS
jgi:hypothetical protein